MLWWVPGLGPAKRTRSRTWLRKLSVCLPTSPCLCRRRANRLRVYSWKVHLTQHSWSLVCEPAKCKSYSILFHANTCSLWKTVLIRHSKSMSHKARYFLSMCFGVTHPHRRTLSSFFSNVFCFPQGHCGEMHFNASGSTTAIVVARGVKVVACDFK